MTDSLMFTFSADQMSIQMESGSKFRQPEVRSIRKRPSSCNPSQTTRSRILSSNSNQLFENSNIQNNPLEGSPQKNINSIKIKSTSIQLNEKKKLRNIIDNMLCKNFDTFNYSKTNGIGISNRKQTNKHRGVTMGTQGIHNKCQYEQKQESKQNQLNLQNIDVKSIKQIPNIQNQYKKRPNIKIKKYQFANLKFHKMNQYSQRYDQSLNDSQEILKVDKNIINMSRDSIQRQSLNKKISRSKTPKIMYPQSDSKLPPVFRTNNPRSSCGNSLGKRKVRISSAQFIQHDNNDKITVQSVTNKEKNSISDPRTMDPLIRTRSRPSTMMGQTRKNTIFIHKKQIQNQIFYPRKLVFENQSIQQSINKKLMHHSGCEDKNLNIRIATRAKSTHLSHHPHRKLKQLSSYLNNQNLKKCDQSNFNPLDNQSHHSKNSKQTFQSSTLHSSTDKTLVNLSSRTQRINQEIACSITFHIPKKE